MERRPGAVGGTRGFTLLELLFVIVIVITLAGMAANALLTQSRTGEVMSMARVVAGTLSYARSRAIVTHVAQGVCLWTVAADGSHNGRIEVYDMPGDDTNCRNTVCGSLDAALRVRDVRLVEPQTQGVNIMNPADETQRLYETTARIDQVLPDAARTVGICFRPDGAMNLANTNRPVPAPNGSGYGAGYVTVQLRDYIVQGSGGNTQYSAIGRTAMVVVPYNGVPRVTY